MINIIDNLRNVLGDKYAFIKIGILSVPAFLAYLATTTNNMVFSSIVNFAFSVIFAAIFFETIRRSCNQEPMLLPSFLNPIRMFITLGGTILASIPAFLVNVGLFYLVFMIVIPNYFPIVFDVNNKLILYIVSTIYAVISASIYFASVTQFLDSGKIFDAYNVIKVYKALATFIANIVVYSIQLLVFNAIAIIGPYFAFMAVFGTNITFFVLYCSFMSVLNYLIYADFLAQTKKESEIGY